MRAVLVTGASGLVGGRLLQHVAALTGIRARAASRLSRAWPPGIDGCVIDPARPETMREAMAGIDAVVNLASIAEPAAARDPIEALKVNAGGALTAATAAAEAGVARFVQVSTYKVYGNNPAGHITEATATAPRSAYAISHRTAEDYVQSAHRGAVVLRLANGFGAPANDAEGAWSVIVNDLCRQAVVDRRIVLRSSGRAWRNFIPLSEVVRALVFAASADLDGIYHLGSSQSCTLREAATAVAGACEVTLGFTPDVSFGPAAADELPPQPLEFSIRRLAAAGFTPAPTFAEEAGRTLLAAQRLFSATPAE